MASTIGIDIGGTKVDIVRMADGAVVARTRTETAPDAPLTPGIFAASREVWADDVAAIGAGVAGLVDAEAGRFVWGPHVSGTGIPVREQLEQELGVPAIVDNDANVAAWAELQAGAGRGYRHMLLVTLGTGIGGAIVVDGEVYRGLGFAGEWGHMRFDPGGLPCDCGKLGCWETVASGPALRRLAAEGFAVTKARSSATVASWDGDKVAGLFGTRAVLESYGCALAVRLPILFRHHVRSDEACRS